MVRTTRPLRLIGLVAATALSFSSAATAQSDKITFLAELDAAQVTGAGSTSLAKGTACAVMDTAADTLTITLVMDGLIANETGAMIHGFAPPGMPAPMLTGIPLGLYKSTVWNYPAASEAQILADLTFVKIHTMAYPMGEIRGQLVRQLQHAVIVGDADDTQVVVASPNTPARGLFVGLVDTVNDTLTYQMTWNMSLLNVGEVETGTHLHGYAGAGVHAPMLHMTPMGFHKKSVWNYPPADEAQILAGNTYIKVHTSQNMMGLIRGQNLVQSTALPGIVNYCTSGTSYSGCSALISATGIPSATAGAGFSLSATSVEGGKNGMFYYGVNGRQGNSWGNGTSFRCVVPPTKRGGLLAGNGTAGTCGGVFTQDLNARWCPSCPKSSHNPGAGAVMQAQLWYRDPLSTSSQTTSFSDAVEFTICP